MIAELAFAFTAGAVAPVNPCGFALLPAYLARRLGVDDDGCDYRNTAITRALLVGAATTLGFLLVFGMCGTVIVLGAAWLAEMFPWVGFVIGLVLAMIGLLVLTGRHPRVPQSGLQGWSSRRGLRGDLLFGLAYGAASLSCTLPIFLAVVGVSTTLGVLGSALSLGGYAVGIGTVLTALSVGAALSRRGLAAMAAGLRPYLVHFSGGLLFLAGAYVAYFWGTTLFSTSLAAAGGVVDVGERLSGFFRGWLTGQAGQTALYLILALMSALWAWMPWRRWLMASRSAPHNARVRVFRDTNGLAPGKAEAGMAAVPDGCGDWTKYGDKP